MELRQRKQVQSEGLNAPVDHEPEKKVGTKQPVESACCTYIILCIPAIVGFILLGLGIVYLNLSGGAHFPNITAGLQPILPGDAVEVVAELPSIPGNIAVSPSGRIFFSFHPEGNFPVKVAEYLPQEKKWVPYPSSEYQSSLHSVLSLRIDPQTNLLWLLDFANFAFFDSPKLVAIDLTTNEVIRSHEFDPTIAGWGSMLNDFQISPDGNHIFIADTSVLRGNPALVIFDTRTNQSRRVLENHESMRAMEYLPRVNGRPVRIAKFIAVRPHVDSIALDNEGQWLYFSPVSHDNLFRVHTHRLLDESLNPVELAAVVGKFAKKTMTDGLTTDSQGNIYLSDFEHSTIHILDTKGKIRTLVKNETLLRWPDGFSFGPDGYLYISCSALHLKYGGGGLEGQGPFHLLRVKALAPGRFGH